MDRCVMLKYKATNEDESNILYKQSPTTVTGTLVYLASLQGDRMFSEQAYSNGAREGKESIRLYRFSKLEVKVMHV